MKVDIAFGGNGQNANITLRSENGLDGYLLRLLAERGFVDDKNLRILEEGQVEAFLNVLKADKVNEILDELYG